MVEMGVLGPLVMNRHGISLVPRASKPRQLLAFLMLNANQTVRATECITELWGNQPPKSAMSTLQTYVLRIRRALRMAGDEDVLLTRSQGYELVVAPPQLDRAVFEQWASAGREAVVAGKDQEAAALFRSALSVWRGSPLSDVRAGPLISMHLVGLRETRRVVLEQRIEADLRLGRHRELLGELSALAWKHRTDENVHAQFMLALYRSGRTPHALRVYRRLMRLLDAELGIEPSPRIQSLVAAIRSADPVLNLMRRGAA
jgi:SARP family transcriptional regulator, regulator of embCAB operon